MSDSQSTQPELQPTRNPNSRDTRYPSVSKLIAIQRVLEGEVMNNETVTTERGTFACVSARDKAACARAWKELELLRRIMLGKPITVEPARLKVPKARKLGVIQPMPSADDQQASGTE